MFPSGTNLIEVIDIQKCDFEKIFIGSNVGIIGSAIHQTDGGAYVIKKFLGEKINSEILLRNENAASINNVFIIVLRTYNTVTAASTGRLLQADSGRVLQQDSVNGTLYISDGQVNEEGEPAPFNWLMFIVIPACSALVLILVSVFIYCCCCKKTTEELKLPKKDKYDPSKAKNATPQESQRTVHDGSNRDVQQPIYMPSDRSLGGKPVPLESRQEIPRTQDNSMILAKTDNSDKSDNTPVQSRENSIDKKDDVTPDASPQRGRRERRERDVSRSREVSQDVSRENTPSKSPRRRVARRRRNR
jgi:hypothetical protein